MPGPLSTRGLISRIQSLLGEGQAFTDGLLIMEPQSKTYTLHPWHELSKYNLQVVLADMRNEHGLIVIGTRTYTDSGGEQKTISAPVLEDPDRYESFGFSRTGELLEPSQRAIEAIRRSNRKENF